jgi:diguanylate cyclase (GGDEF)-like protein
MENWQELQRSPDRRGFWVQVDIKEELPDFKDDPRAQEIFLGIINELVQEIALEQMEIGKQINDGASTETSQGILEAVFLRQSVATRRVIIDQAKERFLSERDHLTNLLNRRAFESRSESEIARFQRNAEKKQEDDEVLALLVIDVDDFKNINTTFGHPGGDEALKKLSDKIQKALRVFDLSGRLGGDELSILLVNTSKKEITETIKRIFSAISDITLSSGLADKKLTLSVGVSILDQKTASAQITRSKDHTDEQGTYKELLQVADSSAYMSKESGKDAFTITYLDNPLECTIYRGEKPEQTVPLITKPEAS